MKKHTSIALQTIGGVSLFGIIFFIFLKVTGYKLSGFLLSFLFVVGLTILALFLYRRMWAKPDPLHGVEAMAKLAQQEEDVTD